MRILLFLLLNSLCFFLLSQNKKIYEFPYSVQNELKKNILLEKIDTFEVFFLLLHEKNDKEILSFYKINKKYHDSLTLSILECNLVANICGIYYPLLLPSDFLYCSKLNYRKNKNSVWISNVLMPHSKFDVTFKGGPYEEGEIIK